MVAGRPAIPTVLKELAGNPGHRPLPEFEASTPKIAFAPTPKGLNKEAKRCWNHIVPMLGAIGLLTEGDLVLIERYCKLTATWYECDRYLAKKKSSFYETAQTYVTGDPTDPEGKRRIKTNILIIKEYPQSKMMLRVNDQLLKIEQHFGMTPASRTKLTIDPMGGKPKGDPDKKSEEDKDEFDD